MNYNEDDGYSDSLTVVLYCMEKNGLWDTQLTKKLV